MKFNNMSSLSKLTKARYLSSVFSVLIMLASIAIIVTNGFNWGLDFTGGLGLTEAEIIKRTSYVP